MKFDKLNESYKCIKIGGILRNLNNDENKIYNLVKSKGRFFKVDMDEYQQQIATSMVSKGILRRKKLRNPEDAHNGCIYYTTIGRSGQLKGNELDEVAPPGKEAESWIRKNKKRFKDRYGKDYEKYLYGKAWNNYNGKRKVKESVGDVPSNDEKYKQQFINRVRGHIARVNKYGSKIGNSYPKHDYDKLNSDLLNYYYLDKKSDYEPLSDKEKDILRKAGMQHRISNPHHPEYWDKGNIESLTTIRSNPTKPFNCQKMPKEALEEMCADWCAMSEEFGNTPFQWWEHIKNKRYLFTPEQEQFILDTLDKMWNSGIKESETLNDEDMLVEDITAYHGSPNDFEQFDTKFMGDGQGAQAHGWGLYFALDPKISKENYQNVYGSNHGLVSYKFNGKSYQKPKLMYYVLKQVYDGRKDKALEILERYLNDREFLNSNPNAEEKIKKVMDEVNKIHSTKDIKKSIKLEQGQFYTVKIPDVEHYLAEESKYYNQPTKIQKKLLKVYKEVKLSTNRLTQQNIEGEQIYDDIKEVLHSKKQASLMLLKHGVKGIYYNGYSDGWCVVVFDHNDVKIVKKDVDYTPNEEAVPANILDILKDDPTKIKEYDNLPTEIQTALYNDRKKSIVDIKNPTKEFLDYVYKDFMTRYYSEDIATKRMIIPYIYDRLSKKDKQELFQDDVTLLLSCGDKLSEAEQNKYIKFYSESIAALTDLVDKLDRIDTAIINTFSERIIKGIIEGLYKKDLWENVSALEIYKRFVSKISHSTRYYDMKTKFADIPELKNLELYLWPSNLTFWFTVENCKITERALQDADKNGNLNACGSLSKHLYDENKTPDKKVCDYIFDWYEKYPDFVKEFVMSEEFIDICGYEEILKHAKTPNALYDLAQLFSYSASAHVNFYENIYTEKYKMLRNSKPLNVSEKEIFNAFIRPAVGIFDSLSDTAKVNLAKVIPYYINEFYMKDILKIFEYYCDYDMQKQLLLKRVEIMRYIPKVDKKIQKAMVDRNPYFVKYLMKPDKQIVKYLLDNYGDEIKDYIRGM